MSQQNAATPRDFIRAVEHKFNVRFTFDIACTTQDCVVQQPERAWNRMPGYLFDQGTDALAQDWSTIKVPTLEGGQEACAWLNPPWKKTYAFAEKCSKGTGTYIIDPSDESVDIWTPGIRIFSLFPAGVGSLWFGNHVLHQADVYFLHPRMTFIDPRTGLPFVNAETGKAQTGLNDAILVDWNGGDQTYWWNWQDTLFEMAREHRESVEDALNRV